MPFISQEHFDALSTAAEAYANDLESGLADGTYEDRADLDDVRAALEAGPVAVQIGVCVEGGIIQNIWSPVELAGFEVVVIDYDTDGFEDCDIREVQQGGSDSDEWSEALVNSWSLGPGTDRSPIPQDRERSPEEEEPAEEVEGFDRCKLSGYKVEREAAFGWLAFTPDEDEITRNSAGRFYGTERAAWEACDHHRMFGEG